MDNEPQYKEQKRIGILMVVAMWVFVLGLLTIFFFDIFNRQVNPNQNVTTIYTQAGVAEVELKRNRYQHYVTDGFINGQQVMFMLDTGSTNVAIPGHIADRLQLERGAAIQVQTATGKATAYVAQLDSVAIGEIKLHNISAVISPSDDADLILLGMSFLKEIEFTQRGDTLVLRQYPQ